MAKTIHGFTQDDSPLRRYWLEDGRYTALVINTGVWLWLVTENGYPISHGGGVRELSGDEACQDALEAMQIAKAHAARPFFAETI